MEKPIRQKPISPPCLKCGDQPTFITSMMDPSKGQTFQMFECKCGDKSWTAARA